MILPLVICLLGLLIYLLVKSAKACEIGRIMFFVGLLVLVWNWAGATVHFPVIFHH